MEQSVNSPQVADASAAALPVRHRAKMYSPIKTRAWELTEVIDERNVKESDIEGTVDGIANEQKSHLWRRRGRHISTHNRRRNRRTDK